MPKILLKYLGQAGFLLKGRISLLFDPGYDPWNRQDLSEGIGVDIVCITHTHRDHFGNLAQFLLRHSSCIALGPPSVVKKLRKRWISRKGIKSMKPGDFFEMGEVRVYALAVKHGPRLPFFRPLTGLGLIPFNGFSLRDLILRPEEIGFLVKYGESIICHLGDSVYFKDLEKIVADIILVGIDGLEGMRIDEVRLLCEKVKPQVVVPMHFSSFFSRGDPIEFKERVKVPGVKTVVLSPGQTMEIEIGKPPHEASAEKT